ncbi:hypothetical protein KAX35_08940, partial [candidate division WOR-3 bacterium]|nr:hypothetical protein [candidate division WOR-3 bacterium]
MLNDGLSPISFQRIINVWRTKVIFKIKRERKEVGMLEKVGGKKMRGIIFPLVLLIGAMVALPLGAIYTPPDRNQNGLPDHIDMMHGIWTIAPMPNADFDADGVPDSLEDANKNGVFEPHLGETDPQCFDTDGDGIIDGAEYKNDHTWLPSPGDPVVTGSSQDADGDGVPNTLDLDSDNDGILDGQFAWVGDPSQPSGSWLSFNKFGGTYRYEVGDVNTNPYLADTDGDGINDGDEVHTYLTNPNMADSDVDGINDFLEIAYGTNPLNPDSDGDGLTDDIEWNLAGDLTIAPDDPDGDGMYSPLDLDSDNDGLLDGVTYSTGTEDNTPGFGGVPRFLNMDSDGDGLADGTEEFLFLTDPYGYTDGDVDGLADELEFKHRLNPNTTDTDGDGIVDSTEAVPGDPLDPLVWDAGWGMYISGTPTDTDGDDMPDARDLDSDNDGLFDGNYNPGWAYADGTFPNENAFSTNWRLSDTDGDGLSDGFEAGNDLDLNNGSGAGNFERTNPALIDTDSDNINDGDELVYGTNPLNVNTDGDSFDPDGPGPLPSYPIYEGLIVDEDYPTWVLGVGYSPPLNGINYVEIYGADHDGYGMEDPLDPIFTDGWLDSDGDGLPDNYELTTRANGGSGTDPYNPDTDGDGLWDGDEWFPHFIDLGPVPNAVNPAAGYRDVLGNWIGAWFSSDPLNPDTDGDGLLDGFIDMNSDYGFDTTDGDIPGELTMGWIKCAFINPGVKDTMPRQSSGSLKKAKAINLSFDFRATNPRLADTDNDSLVDGVTYPDSALSDRWDPRPDSMFLIFWDYEEGYGDPDADGMMNALDLDSDGDGATDYQEYRATKHPLHLGIFGSTNPGAEPLVDSVLRYSDRLPIEFTQFNYMWDFANNTLLPTFYSTANSDHIVLLSSDPDNEPDQDEIDGFWKSGGQDGFNPCKGYMHQFTNPLDTDGDRLLDGMEDLEGSAVGVMDTDGDGLYDGDEVLPVGTVVNWAPRRTDPTLMDTDNDGLNDNIERAAGSPLGAGAVFHWTDPLMRDTDGDSVGAVCGLDGQEDANANGVWDFGAPDFETDPRNPDSDDDWIKDCIDLTPLVADTDGDGLKDGHEICLGTLFNDADTEDDGFLDGWGDAPWAAGVGFGGNGDGLYTGGEQPGEFGEYDPITGFTGIGMVYAQGLEGLLIDTDFDIVQGGTEHGLSTVYAGGGPIATDYFPDAIALPLCSATSVGVIVVDADGGATTTDPLEPDEDNDNLFNGWVEDINQNGLWWAATETDPNAIDTDGDGVPGFPLPDGYDGWETVTIDQPDVDGTTNALDTDSDGDGITDGAEVASWVTSPLLTDTDGDGRNEGLSPATNEGVNIDSEGDGIINALDIDSDNDWLIDGDGTLFGFAYAPGTYPSTGEDNGLPPTGVANNGILEDPPSGPVGVQETDPTVPEDSDGDGLPDWVELSFFGPTPGFDGAPAWLDLDYDDDGMKDAYCIGALAPAGYDMYGPWPTPFVIGEENATVPIFPTPYGVPPGNFYTTDPRLVDSDFDIIQDGTEVMVVTGIPPGPPGTFGTNLGIFTWDRDAAFAIGPATFTNPFDADTDNDGLPDGGSTGEDLPTIVTAIGNFGDGKIAGDLGFIGPGTWGVWDPTDPGWTETDPNDIDTDEDGLLDSWEVNWAQTDPWTLDTEGDLLSDGLEWHVGTRPTAPPVPGPVIPWGGAFPWTNTWNPNAGNGANGGFAFMSDGDIASMTDPNCFNTDLEGFGDGGEDINTNGVWDFTGNPYVWSTTAPTGETNPCDRDSDHGGVIDGLDPSPLRPRRPDGALDPGNEASLPNGDDSYEIKPFTLPFPAGADTTLRSGRDTLFIDPVPGDSGTGMFVILNTGPVNLDDIYATCTDLDWAFDVATYTVPLVGLWPDTLIIPFDSVDIWGVDEGVKIGPHPAPAPIITSTGGPPNNGLPIGDLDDEVWVRVHIPWGQIPGVYEGRLVLWQGDPFFNNPIDTIVFQVEVDP